MIYVAVVVWIYFLYIFKKKSMDAFYFLVGGVGFFGFMMYFFIKPLIYIMSKFMMVLLDLVSYVVPICSVFPKYNIIFVETMQGSISLYMDYECCGVIEILALLSLILFYPLFKIWQKPLLSVLGFFYIAVSNVIRIISIIVILKNLGNDYYYIAHSIIGRIVFYALTLVFYFYLFTYNQIKNQRVGNFSFNAKSNENK